MLLISLTFLSHHSLNPLFYTRLDYFWIFLRREGEGVGLIPKVFHQVKMENNMYPTSIQITNHTVLVSLLGLCNIIDVHGTK